MRKTSFEARDLGKPNCWLQNQLESDSCFIAITTHDNIQNSATRCTRKVYTSYKRIGAFRLLNIYIDRFGEGISSAERLDNLKI